MADLSTERSGDAAEPGGPEADAGAELSLDPPTDTLVGSVLDDKFRLERILAKGGAGRVYVARQLNLDRAVAVKVLRPDLDPEGEQRFEERFFREASMAGQLQHPHVVTVHDYGRTEAGICYIAMELLAGRSLKERMKGGPIPPAEALPWFEQIVRGLRHAHRKGMVHRDMKPGNVQLVPGEEGRDFAKILDFGLVTADSAESEITRDGYFVGTPHYAAPEQVKGLEVDHRADLYSVGVMLYRALCGRLPYWSKQGMAIAVSHVHDPYPPMSERAPGVEVPELLEAIVRRCMEKEPARRYSDASSLLIDLRAARAQLDPHGPVSHEHSVSLITALPEGPTEPLPEASEAGSGVAPSAAAGGAEDDDRSRRGMWAALGAAALLAGVAGVGGWQALRPGAPVEAPAAAVAPLAAPSAPAGDTIAALAEDPADAVRDVALLISSEPSGAQVELDGAILGETPLATRITVRAESGPAERTVRLTRDGFLPQELTLDVSGEQVAANASLQPVPRAKPAAPTPSVERDAGAPAATATAPPSMRDRVRDRPASSSGGAPSGAVSADGVSFTADEARKALAFLASADKDALLRAGVAPRQANLILDKRPFASLQAFAATPYIGEKTVQAVRDAAR